jgi:hypothetical protein
MSGLDLDSRNDGAAVHLVPAYLPNPPQADPVWEATRPDRGPVTHDVICDVERGGEGWQVTEPEPVPCYGEAEALMTAARMQARGKRNVRIVPRVS